MDRSASRRKVSSQGHDLAALQPERDTPGPSATPGHQIHATIAASSSPSPSPWRIADSKFRLRLEMGRDLQIRAMLNLPDSG